MKRLHAIAVSIAALACAMAGCGGGQPSIGCPVQQTTWAAKFVLKDGQDASAVCARKSGERIGIQKFNTPGTTENKLVMKPETLARLDARDPSHPAFSEGSFASQADANDFCAAPSLSAAEKHAEATAASPAVDIVYQWSNVRVLARPDAPGSQLVADLTYTENGCTAQYEVWGVFPAVSCKGADGTPDDSICSDPSHGVNEDFSLVCDPSSLRCVPAQRPPSLK